MSIPTRTAGPVERADFGADAVNRSFANAVIDYRARLRSGELGSLPALFGLAVLIILFALSSPVFLSLTNLANLLSQGAGRTIIAMGLVFVLLLGEIDVSAGAASGVTAAMLALHYVSDGNMLGAMSTPVFLTFTAVGLVTVGLAIWMRIWAAVLIGLIPPAILLLGIPANPWVEMLLAVTVGASIGTLSGFLVAKVRIPSFVITLALFLTWQGVILLLIGDGGVLGINTDPTLRAVANGNLDVGMSWLLYGASVALFVGLQFTRYTRRSRRGLTTSPLSVVMIKAAAVVVLGAAGTWLLTIDRSQNANLVIAGVPFVVPIVLALLVAGTYVLDHTAYGRYIYAVGGNAEAARRAGIDVAKIRGSVFIVSASFAALGAIVYSSKVGSVDPTAGGLNTLLFAVGAAVIGGTSLFGGRGRVSNAVIGGLVLAVVENGLGLLNQPAAIVAIVTGLVLALAATVDALSRMRSTKG
ncbi:sugar ABC transporter permease [Mycolicibacterium sp.]|uniref:sugar ABC transporter permease n=1 Tax=Mycolicibacterium sp. TaxID=2320850 RepID=UPI003D0F25BC